MFWTKEMTKALDEGYEIRFKAAKEYGPKALVIKMKKGDTMFQAYEDFILCGDDEDVANALDSSIRFMKFNFKRRRK